MLQLRRFLQSRQLGRLLHQKYVIEQVLVVFAVHRLARIVVLHAHNGPRLLNAPVEYGSHDAHGVLRNALGFSLDLIHF